MNIVPGTVFSTQFEEGCTAQSAPDEHGNFDGLDSDGVEVTFHVRMIQEA